MPQVLSDAAGVLAHPSVDASVKNTFLHFPDPEQNADLDGFGSNGQHVRPLTTHHLSDVYVRCKSQNSAQGSDMATSAGGNMLKSGSSATSSGNNNLTATVSAVAEHVHNEKQQHRIGFEKQQHMAHAPSSSSTASASSSSDGKRRLGGKTLTIEIPTNVPGEDCDDFDYAVNNVVRERVYGNGAGAGHGVNGVSNYPVGSGDRGLGTAAYSDLYGRYSGFGSAGYSDLYASGSHSHARRHGNYTCPFALGAGRMFFCGDLQNEDSLFGPAGYDLQNEDSLFGRNLFGEGLAGGGASGDGDVGFCRMRSENETVGGSSSSTAPAPGNKKNGNASGGKAGDNNGNASCGKARARSNSGEQFAGHQQQQQQHQFSHKKSRSRELSLFLNECPGDVYTKRSQTVSHINKPVLFENYLVSASHADQHQHQAGIGIGIAPSVTTASTTRSSPTDAVGECAGLAVKPSGDGSAGGHGASS